RLGSSSRVAVRVRTDSHQPIRLARSGGMGCVSPDPGGRRLRGTTTGAGSSPWYGRLRGAAPTWACLTGRSIRPSGSGGFPVLAVGSTTSVRPFGHPTAGPVKDELTEKHSVRADRIPHEGRSGGLGCQAVVVCGNRGGGC